MFSKQCLSRFLRPVCRRRRPPPPITGRTFVGTNLFSGRLPDTSAAAAARLLPDDTLSVAALQDYFCRSLETHFRFSSDESRRTTGVCRPIFGSQLRSMADIDSTVSMVASNFTAEDIKFNPQIFVLHPRTLRKRLEILREFGFRRLSVAASESCFRTVVRQSVSSLRESGLLNDLKKPILLVRHLLDTAGVDNEFRRPIEKHFANKSLDDMSVDEIRRSALAKYISILLSIDLDRTERLTAGQKFGNVSLSLVVTNALFLTRDIGMSCERIAKNVVLLTLDTQNARNIVNRAPVIGGQSTRELVFKYPKLLDTRWSTLEANMKLLKESGFSDKQIASAVSVLTLKTREIGRRIDELKLNDDLRPFIGSDRALRIVVQWKDVLTRVDELRQQNLSEMTMDSLIASEQYFEGFRERLTRAERGQRSRKTTLAAFVNNRLNLDLDGVRQRIGTHPLVRRFCAENAEKVWHYLHDEQQVTVEQLAECPFVFLYDPDVVRKEFTDLFDATDDHHCYDRRQETCLIQLLVYFIEKKFGFSGNGVFKSEPLSDVHH